MRAQQRTESTEGKQRIEAAMQARGQPDRHHHPPEASLPPKPFTTTTGTHLPWQASTGRFTGPGPRRASTLSSRGIPPRDSDRSEPPRIHKTSAQEHRGVLKDSGKGRISGKHWEVFGKCRRRRILEPEGAFLVILTGLGPVRKDPLQSRGKSGGSGGARTRNLCRDRAAL